MAAKRKMAMTRTQLTAVEKQALQEFVEYLRTQVAQQVRQVSLFGSKARGDSKSDSDMDVLVILKDENRPLRREIIKQAARLSLKYDVCISPRVIGEARWKQMRGFSLYQNVQREATNLPMIESDAITSG